MTTGTIPLNALENDEKQGHYNLHKRIEYANSSTQLATLHEEHPHEQAFYSTVVHTTTRSLKN
eukprot:2201931-Amphidinium_carterae.3